MKVVLYAAVARNGVIGRDGDMPWRLSTDLKRFKSDTMGKPIIMGRKTWESFPRRPLPGRLNIVISRDANYPADGASVVTTYQDALSVAAASGAEEAAILGGGTIYNLAVETADRLHITHVLADIDGDTWFPEIVREIWREVESQDFPAGERDSHPTRYAIYERI